MMPPEILDIGLIIVCTAVAAMLGTWLKQPLIPCYIIVGLLIGPQVLGFVESPESIAHLSEITIIFLLFVVGMEMNIGRIKAVGSVVSVGGGLQVLSVGIAGALLAKIWFSWVTSAYIGLTFSLASTMLVIQILSDRKQLEHLSGRIIVGILLVQDILTILALSVFTTTEFSGKTISTLVFVSLGMVATAVFLGRFIFPKLLELASGSTAALMLVALGICFIFVLLFRYQGLSPAIGAFVIGVSLAHCSYSLELLGKFRTLRDFFIPLFFASLGMQIAMPGTEMILPIIVLFLAAILLKPLLTSIVISLFGYKRRTAFVIGGSLIPLSEFGPVLIALGISLGYFGHEVMTVILIVMVLSMIVYSYVDFEKLYPIMGPYLAFLDKLYRGETKEEKMEQDGEDDYEAIIIGADRIGGEIIRLLHGKKRIKVLELNPELLKKLAASKIPCAYADAISENTWEEIRSLETKVVICTVPNAPDLNEKLMLYFKKSYPETTLILTTNDLEEAQMLCQEGVYVIYPDWLASIALDKDAVEHWFSKDALKGKQLLQQKDLAEKPSLWTEESPITQT